MFDALSDRFDGIFTRFRGRGRLSEADVDEVLREIRLALLEADVNFKVVRTCVARIRERCVGDELSQALSPAQQVIKIVNDELTTTLGGETIRITYASKPPTVVLMAGLQGSGKTTNSAKLARWFKSQGRNPLLVGADLQRPAAVEQLRTLGSQVDVPVFSEPTDPVSVARAGVAEARRRRSRRRHRRHRRPAGHRRRADGRGPADLRGGRARLHVPRRRRDDRPGRGQRRRVVPPDPRARRRHPHQARRRRPRRRGALGEGGRRSADRLRVDRREARRTSTSSIPTASPGASSAWATCSR